MTTEHKHTPGPWRYAEALENNAPNYFVITNGKRNWKMPTIATCHDKADAQLIAAAPDLLSALIELAECSPCLNGCKPDDMACASNQARAAIAKAIGKGAV